MSGLRLRRALLVIALLSFASAAPASAARIAAGKLPASIVLPSGWVVGALAPGTRFDASATSGYARLEVTSGGSFPSSLPFSEFVQIETSSARRSYRAEDPTARVTWRKVTLPSGPAVEIFADLDYKGNPLAIVLFSLLHRGTTFHFTYFTNQASIGHLRGAFEASARSIRFTG